MTKKKPTGRFLSSYCSRYNHRLCHAPSCSCYCHVNVDEGESRPGVPSPDATHFLLNDLREGIKKSCNQAFVRNLSRADIAATVRDAMRELDYYADIFPRVSSKRSKT